MPVDENKNLYHEPPKPSDPAHGTSSNDDHTTTSGTKPTSVVEAVTDPSFFPTLDKAPLAQKIKSHLLLACIVYGGVAVLWLSGFTLFQTRGQLAPDLGAVEIPLAPPDLYEDSATETRDALAVVARETGLMTAGVVGAAVLAMLYSTGTTNVDFWSLTIEYGWWTLPAVGAAGLLFVLMQESSEDIKVVS
ncbi:hypothetical protein LQW54_007325 [Pestalotiopsis sp. IQ-011]